MSPNILDNLDIQGAYTLVTGRTASERRGVARVHCPARNHPDNHASCDLDCGKNLWICRSCNAKGGILDLPVAAALAKDRASAARWFEDKLGKCNASTPTRINSSNALTSLATVSQLAQARSLDEAELRRWGLRDTPKGVEIPLLDLNGAVVGRRCRRHLERANPTIWLDGDRIAYNPDTMLMDLARKTGELTIVEGESDCWTLWHHGVPAVGIPGATMVKLISDAHVRDLHLIYVVREPDKGGVTFLNGVIVRLAALRFDGAIKVIDLNESYALKDPSDLHTADPAWFLSRWSSAVNSAQPAVSTRDSVQPSDQLALTTRDPIQPADRAVRLVLASTMAPIETRFVVYPYIPRGEATWLEGPMKSGKTMAALDVIARITRGESIDGKEATAGRAAILTCEDDYQRTIVPRLIAAGAIMERVAFVYVQKGDSDLLPSLVTDLDQIAEALRRFEADILLVDGTFGFLGVRDGSSYTEAYAKMVPLVAMVRDLDIGALIVRHIRKTGGSALNRGIGSVGYGALGRSTICIIDDAREDSDGDKLWAHAGSNVGEIGDTLGFRIEGVAIESLSRPVGRVSWTGPVDLTADEAMAACIPSEDKERSAAEVFLNDFLTEPKLASDVFLAAQAADIPRRSLQRTAKRIGVEITHAGFAKGTLWRLPIGASNVHLRRDDNPGADGADGIIETSVPGLEAEAIVW